MENENKIKELRIHTPIGDIIAYPNGDPAYPGITLMFAPKGADTEIDVCRTEVKQNDLEKDDDNVHVYTYENVYDEDFTRKFELNKSEALKALGNDEQYVETNIGRVSIADYRDIKAQQSGFDDYEDMYNQGYRIGNGYDKT